MKTFRVKITQKEIKSLLEEKSLNEKGKRDKTYIEKKNKEETTFKSKQVSPKILLFLRRQKSMLSNTPIVTASKLGGPR